jgi:tryptophan 2,3-dioxygenase
MLFITVHQAFELWFKQILFELDWVVDTLAQDYVAEREIGLIVARLQRVTEIQRVIVEHLRILETMTPLDFLEFRDHLAPASGSQSVQFRLIEVTLGLERSRRILYHQAQYWRNLLPEDRDRVERAERMPSLFDLVDRWLSRTPFLDFGSFHFWRAYRRAVERMLESDRAIILRNRTLDETTIRLQLDELDRTRQRFSLVFDREAHAEQVRQGHWRLSYEATLAALLIFLYRDRPILHEPFRFLTTLIDIDELLTAWRYRHALMVQRLIGAKVGAGSTGQEILTQAAEGRRVFADLFNLSTFLIPRSLLPALPESVERALGFSYVTNVDQDLSDWRGWD